MPQSLIRNRRLPLSFAQRMALMLYSLLLGLVLPLVFARWVVGFMIRTPQQDTHRLSRFAIYCQPVMPTDLLIHCVSVGEVAVAAALIKRWREKQPDLSVTLTTTTPTGAANVKNLLGDSVQHLYLPFDLSWLMARLLNRVKPTQVCIVEVELWPNMIRQCHRQGIPVFLVNGRMTDKSADAYSKLSALVRPMLQSLDFIFAQSQRDLDNYLRLECNAARATVSGNIKFDMQPPANATAQSLVEQWQWQFHQILLAGSTHEPEEDIMLDVYRQLLQSHPQLRLVIVPRHPQRFDKVEEIIKKSTQPYARSSVNSDDFANAKVILVDQMGVLGDLYRYADIAFVGGSIADRGGHNPLEAANVAVPIIMGDKLYNNPGICQVLIDVGSIEVASDAKTITNICERWLSDRAMRDAAGQAGKTVIADNRGAINNTLKILLADKPPAG